MRLATPNVLIVEKDSKYSELLTELIDDVVHAKIDSTNSGERALELVSSFSYQLVVVDSGVGDMDGLSILERVKRVSPATGVILVSAFATVEEAVKAMRSGADEYFKKPFNPENFKLSIRRCLDRRDLYSGDESITGMMLLLNACQLVSGCLEEEKIFETVTGYIRRLTSASAVGLFKLVGDQKVRVPTSLDLEADVVEVIVEGHNFLKVCAEEKGTLKVLPKVNGTPEVAIFQFRCTADTPCFVVCLNPKWSIPLEEVDSRFRLLQAQIQMTGRNIQSFEGVRYLLHLDEPTGLYNTRYLHLCLDQHFDAWNRGEIPAFSVLFLDVDKFKGINDSHGHLVGTKLLLEMGAIIRGIIKKQDYAFRYGGDEFVMLLTDTDVSKAVQIAEEIRTRVEQNLFLAREGLNIRLTVSIGIANCPENATTKRDIIEAADGAMYIVKRSTRNRVYLAEKKAA
jgi:two-component system cell cycle response regulator